MELKKNLLHKQTTQGNLNDPKEFNRLLMQYGGIFKNNIREYADKVIPKNKKTINYSR